MLWGQPLAGAVMWGLIFSSCLQGNTQPLPDRVGSEKMTVLSLQVNSTFTTTIATNSSCSALTRNSQRSLFFTLIKLQFFTS